MFSILKRFRKNKLQCFSVLVMKISSMILEVNAGHYHQKK
jgi:hypothetical protein